MSTIVNLPPCPKPTDSNLDHARVYHRLGWWVFPGRSPLDLAQLRQSLLRQGRTAEDAAAETERRRKSTLIKWRERRAAGERPTEAEIVEWFEHEPLRPVIVLTGETAPGVDLVGVDVDPTSGGDPAPWTRAVVTMLARTPRGGWHALHVSESDALTSSAGQVAPGIDIRAAGGLLVMPSGEEATPGRSWERWGVPSPAPVAEIRARLATRRAQASGAEADATLDDAARRKPFAVACLDAAPDGCRQERAKTLIGMLARRGPLPGDARAAALALLGDWCEVRGVDDDLAAMLRSGWLAHLQAAQRPDAFALEVLRAWNRVRCEPQWPADKVASVAASLWGSSAGNEAARVAERVHVEDDDDAAPMESEPDDGLVPVRFIPEDDDEPGPEFKPESLVGTIWEATAEDIERAHEEISGAVVKGDGHLISRLTGKSLLQEGAVLTAEEAAAIILPTRRGKYGRKEYQAKLATPVLSCSTLPRWCTITRDGLVEANSEHGHGLGPKIDEVLAGGLRPGNLVILGAKTAKAGKTALADQICDGVLLRSLDTLDAIKRGEDAGDLIVVRFDFSEMSEGDLTDRQLGRWLGIDSTTFRRGLRGAELAPGVLRMAPQLHMTPRALADHVLALGEEALEVGRLADLRDLQHFVNLEQLPDRGETGQDEQSGVAMLRRVTSYIKTACAVLAERWGVQVSRICPLLFIDPVQRFQGGSDGEAVGALDAFSKALKFTATRLNAIVIATSDTTKAEATGSGAAKPGAKSSGKPTDTRDQGERVASTLRGSYGLTHAADLTLLLIRDNKEEVKPGQPIKVCLETGANRWFAGNCSIPLLFYPETGRYVVRPQEQLTAQPDDDEQVPRAPVPSDDDEDTTSDVELLLADARENPGPTSLTDAVATVAVLFAQGHSAVQIAAIRGVQEGAISRQIKTACGALGVSKDLLATQVKACIARART